MRSYKRSRLAKTVYAPLMRSPVTGNIYTCFERVKGTCSEIEKMVNNNKDCVGYREYEETNTYFKENE